MSKESRETIIVTMRVAENGELLINEPSPSPQAPTNWPATVLFTGFKATDRDRLEALAIQHGMVLRKSPSHMLTYVVAGPTAGPAKLANSAKEGAIVLTEVQFLRLLSTGELPPGDPEVTCRQ